MYALWKTSIRRSWLAYSLLCGLFAFAYLQVTLFSYFNFVESLANLALQMGYLIGIFGFLLGIITIQFIIVRGFTSELGSLETLGFTRQSYVLFFFLQFSILLAIAFFTGAIVFQIIYISKYFKAVSYSSLSGIHFKVILQLGLLFSVTAIGSFILVSRKDPILMLKEK